MSNKRCNEKEIIFIQAPPQDRGYDVVEEDKFYEKYWNIYCSNLHTHKVNYPIWEMPLWIPFLGGILETEGINSRFLDLSHFCGKQSYYKGKEFTYDEVFSFLENNGKDPAIYLLSPLTSNYNLTIEVAKAIKEINAENLVIFGGVHASFTDTECIKSPYVDFIVRGDGEWNTPELIKKIILGEDPVTIGGITYKTGSGQIIRTPSPSLPRTPRLDYFPKYEFFPSNFGEKVPYLRTCLNRGCPHYCAFCDDMWNNMAPQEYPIEWTIKEIQFLKKRFGNNLFYLNDETFLCKRQKARILRFCEEIGHLKVRWIVQTRIDELDRDVLVAMKSAGCEQVELGCETTVQESLNLVNKGTKAYQIKEALEMVKEVGMSTYGYWMVGLPLEDENNIIKTQSYIVDLIKEGLLDLLNYSILVPYPGTRIFKDPNRFGVKILTYDYAKYHEYGMPVYQTKKLSPIKIFNLWKRGLDSFSEVL